MIAARITIDVEAETPDPHRPEATQLRELASWIVSRLGFGPQFPRSPTLRSAQVVDAVVVASSRHPTPIEGAVAHVADDVTAKIDVKD